MLQLAVSTFHKTLAHRYNSVKTFANLQQGWSFLQCPITSSSFLSETSSEWAVPSMFLPTFCAWLLMYSLRRLRLSVQLPSFLSKTSLELSLMVHSQQYGLFFPAYTSFSLYPFPHFKATSPFSPICYSSNCISWYQICALVSCYNKKCHRLGEI